MEKILLYTATGEPKGEVSTLYLRKGVRNDGQQELKEGKSEKLRQAKGNL